MCIYKYTKVKLCVCVYLRMRVCTYGGLILHIATCKTHVQHQIKDSLNLFQFQRGALQWRRLHVLHKDILGGLIPKSCDFLLSVLQTEIEKKCTTKSNLECFYGCELSWYNVHHDQSPGDNKCHHWPMSADTMNLWMVAHDFWSFWSSLIIIFEMVECTERSSKENIWTNWSKWKAS